MAIGVLVGFAAGVVMTAVAGARRTDSSLHRVVVDTRAADVLANPDNGTFAASRYRQLARLPEVARSSIEVGAPMVPVDASGRPDFGFVESARGTAIIASPDGAELRTIDRAAVAAGRMPAPDDTNALVINETAEKVDHLHVGAGSPSASSTRPR
ncbi:MAG TPA: hypothetical protein VH914_17525 [Acidimicrobiia bacterium]|jgi:hypothetical protein|nr:hypothetical protein [Acidimicrobiia bacterium]